MKTNAPAATLFVALLGLFLLEPAQAQAYLDPGTGSAVIQMVIAVVMGSLFVIKTYWRKIVARFNGASETERSDATPTDDAS